jgi:nitrite reductase/ring-hydroxylating ferredoxin subunit
MTTHLLCNNDELIENKSRSFSVETEQGPLDLFVVKIDNEVYAYKNYCPHLGIPLNWQPDDFLSIEETHIQCATHGALFTLEKGNCIAGPCSGDQLEKLKLEKRDNQVWLQL